MLDLLATGHAAVNLTAVVALLGFLLVAVKLIIAIGKLVSVVEKVPGEMDGIREELKQSGENTLLVLQKHGEDIAVIKNMLNLDDSAQAKAGPRITRRRGREL